MSKQRKTPTATSSIEAFPPDHEHRQRILQELDATMLVEAAAGTGKTTSMIGRMIALLREGKCHIDTLAAVTFTRKSTAELRARFQIALERAAAVTTGVAGHPRFASSFQAFRRRSGIWRASRLRWRRGPQARCHHE